MMFIIRYFRNYSRQLEISIYGRNLARRIGYGVIGLAVFTLLWTLAVYIVFTRPGYEQFSGFLPGPTLTALYKLVLEASFWDSVFASLRRVVVGISLSLVAGLPFGLLIGFYSKLRLITYPPMQFLRMISPLSWMPIALLVFASFESAIYFLITMATVWPIVINTALGVSSVNAQWIKMARNQGANNLQLIFQVIIPSSIPFILSSLRMALGVAWIVLVPAEFLGISSGLGYMINDARDTLEYDRLMAILVAIGILGFILDGAVELIQKSFNWSWS